MSKDKGKTKKDRLIEDLRAELDAVQIVYLKEIFRSTKAEVMMEELLLKAEELNAENEALAVELDLTTEDAIFWHDAHASLADNLSRDVAALLINALGEAKMHNHGDVDDDTDDLDD